MRLKTKLGLSTGALVAAMLLGAAIESMVIVNSSRLSTRINSRIALLVKVRSIRWDITESVRQLQSAMLAVSGVQSSTGHGRKRAELLQEAEKLCTEAQSDVHNMMTAGDRLSLQQVTEEVSRLEPLEEKIEKVNEERTPESSAQANGYLQEISTLEISIARDMSALADSQKGFSADDLIQMDHANRMAILTLWMTTLLGVAGGGVISMMIADRTAQAVNLVANRANSIAGGDLTGSALPQGRTDELGMLAEAMNRMQASLRGIIGTVADTAGSLTDSAASMGSASDQIHRRIDEQSQQTQQAASAMQEMSASIAEVSRHTQSAAETARCAAQTAREGGAIVKRMLGSMHTIATAVTETTSTVGLLGEDSRRISQIVTVIDEIARKTNLLALNAAIEAARAGEQGRGFAVVAGEVRRLAESTAQATGEIGSMIQEIQGRTRSAVASMAAGTGTVAEGVVTTTQAGEALERIIGMAEQVDRMITQIAIAASQQATAADQSSASLNSIYSLSEDNLTEMATTVAGIASLRGTAVRLETQVDRFQVVMS